MNHNYDIFNLVNLYLRKAAKSEPLTIERFSSLLIQESYNHFKELVPIYEQDQNVQDSLNPFVVSTDVSLETTTSTTITVPSFYAHFVGMYYENSDSEVIPFDIVTDDVWDMRLSRTLDLPTDDDPICKISGDKIYVYPYFSADTTGVYIYYGSGSQSLSVAEIQLLSQEQMTAGNKRCSYSPNEQVCYIAYPSSYGALVSILDTNGYEVFSDWTRSTQTIATLSYYVYEFDNLTTQTDFYYTFKF
jgi:hypothetical protein